MKDALNLRWPVVGLTHFDPLSSSAASVSLRRKAFRRPTDAGAAANKPIELLTSGSLKDSGHRYARAIVHLRRHIAWGLRAG